MRIGINLPFTAINKKTRQSLGLPGCDQQS